MILNRLGNKTKIAKEIQKHFPKHDIYMEMFFGAGGMYFNKPKAKYNFVNDLDDDVYNVFRQLIDNTDELVDMIKTAPITERQFKEWGKGQREIRKTPKGYVDNLKTISKNDVSRWSSAIPFSFGHGAHANN